MEGHSRRELLRIAAGAVAVAPAVPALAQQAASPALRFFTPAEFRMVDELSELIIPADDHSPGARAAGVAAYLDKSLSEAFDERPRRDFREGLKRVDGLSQELHGAAFMNVTPDQRVAVVTRMAQNEHSPQKPEEHFFGRLKASVAFAYYTSKIGIHQEMEYKGNTVQNEFSGFDASLVQIQLPKEFK